MKNKYFPVIGLEIHVELETKTKMFCACSANHFNKEPNTQTCPVCLGLPGALPVPNQEALRRTILLALSLHCQINTETWFDRKNYFYPDLAKGYQITQFFRPLGKNGQIILHSNEVKKPEKIIRIKEIHLEEDTAKSIIKDHYRQLDFNKSGVPLMEIVSQPDITTALEAKIYGQQIQQIVKRLKISSANMAQGQMRLEANISLKKKESDPLPNYRVEIKNINSFRYLQQAIEYEIERQSKRLDNCQTIPQQTRGFNADKKITYLQRSKENAYEYRYFPEPDIPPLDLDKLFDLRKIEKSLPLSPAEARKRLIRNYRLSPYQAKILVEKYPQAEKTFKIAIHDKINIADVANAIINKDFSLKKIGPKAFIRKLKKKGDISFIEGEKLNKLCQQILKENPLIVEKYHHGKTSVLGFFIGQIQQKTKGKANVSQAKKYLMKLLKK